MRETGFHAGLSRARNLAAPVALSLSAALVSGCVGSPTYGTGKSADQQLVEDVTGILSLGQKDKERITYNPRPGLVMPASTEVLPPPQEDVVTSNNPAWPESPEERLARIRAEATANQNNPAYRSPVVRDVAAAGAASEVIDDRDERGVLNPAAAKRKREQVLSRQAELNNLDPAQRRYLSQPPAEYRTPTASAPVGELGEDEAAKERAAKAAARKQGGGGWRWPWGG